MQASKIKIDWTYALQTSDGRLVRLKIKQINSTRRDNSPGGITSTVHGFVDESRELTGPFPTDSVLGEYREYQELVAAKAAADARLRALVQETSQLRTEAAALLAQLACPGVNDLRGKIETGHSGVNIRDAALPGLVAFLKTCAPAKVA